MSVSDEALVYLIYKNKRDVWIKMIETDDYKKCDVKPKYTADRGGSILNNGWSREGLICFNNYVKWVKYERKKKVRKDYESKFLEFYRNSDEVSKEQEKRKREELEAIIPYTDPLSDNETDEGNEEKYEEENEEENGEENEKEISEENEEYHDEEID